MTPLFSKPWWRWHYPVKCTTQLPLNVQMTLYSREYNTASSGFLLKSRWYYTLKCMTHLLPKPWWRWHYTLKCTTQLLSKPWWRCAGFDGEVRWHWRGQRSAWKEKWRRIAELSFVFRESVGEEGTVARNVSVALKNKKSMRWKCEHWPENEKRLNGNRTKRFRSLMTM